MNAKLNKLLENNKLNVDLSAYQQNPELTWLYKQPTKKLNRYRGISSQMKENLSSMDSSHARNTMVENINALQRKDSKSITFSQKIGGAKDTQSQASKQPDFSLLS